MRMARIREPFVWGFLVIGRWWFGFEWMGLVKKFDSVKTEKGTDNDMCGRLSLNLGVGRWLGGWGLFVKQGARIWGGRG